MPCRLGNSVNQLTMPQFISLSVFPSSALFGFCSSFLKRFSYQSITSIRDEISRPKVQHLTALHEGFTAKLSKGEFADIRYHPFSYSETTVGMSGLEEIFRRISEISRGTCLLQFSSKLIV